MDKIVVINLSDSHYPVAEYPENTQHHADIRLAYMVAREFWETRRRIRKDSSSPETWEKRNQDDIAIDIKAVYDLLNRGIVK